MHKSIVTLVIVVAMLAFVNLAEAQQAKVYRVGVITPGGLWYESIDGLRVGLRRGR